MAKASSGDRGKEQKVTVAYVKLLGVFQKRKNFNEMQVMKISMQNKLLFDTTNTFHVIIFRPSRRDLHANCRRTKNQSTPKME